MAKLFAAFMRKAFGKEVSLMDGKRAERGGGAQ